MITLDNILKRNYQRVSTNRFVVDSPRFWRRELHPRFKDIFTYSDFQDVCILANTHLSFPFDTAFLQSFSIRLYEWFSGQRFVDIPTSNPQCTNEFLASLYFTLLDIFPQIEFKDKPLIEDDFNVVMNMGETNKRDTTRLATDEHNAQDTTNLTKTGTDEHNRQGSKKETELDILTNGEMRNRFTGEAQNIDEESNQNNKTDNDVFLSPQNQGVKPNTESVKYEGVDGVTIPPNPAFTTNTQTQVFGDTTTNKSNMTDTVHEGENKLTQDNDARTRHATDTDFGMNQFQGAEQTYNNETGMNQSQENATEKGDIYREQLDFDKAKKLQEYYDLSVDRLWREILARLSRWILQIDIATAERNYNKYPLYD